MKSPVAATLLVFVAALAACAPSPQESVMHNRSPDPGSSAKGSREAQSEAAPSGSVDQERAAVGPSPAPVSAAENPMPPASSDSPAEAQGRRTLSTAFVQVGPDGSLTVELRGGRVLVLRDVVLRAKDYCGEQLFGSAAGKKYCGGYADVAAARPGGAPIPKEPNSAN